MRQQEEQAVARCQQLEGQVAELQQDGAAKQADLQGARGQLEATAADLAAEREAVAALAGGGQAATCWGDALGVAVGVLIAAACRLLH